MGWEIYGIPVEALALAISLLALFFSALKDFIIPWINGPKILFEYENKLPFKKDSLLIAGTDNRIACFLRVRVTNIGKSPAANCRCQVYTILKGEDRLDEFQGFPLRWASRPEPIIDQIKGERLSIGPGESEFIDIAQALNGVPDILLTPYHNVPIGIPGKLENTDLKHHFVLIFSGDNFKPYRVEFDLERRPGPDIYNIFINNFTFHEKFTYSGHGKVKC